MTGSQSGSEPGTLDVWSYSVVVDAAGVWQYDVAGTVALQPVRLPSGVFLVGVDAPTGGPCGPWCTWADAAACEPGAAGVPAVTRELALDVASEILFNLSGGVYPGICEATRSICWLCMTCAPRVCCCDPIGALDFGPRWPIWGAWDVTVDGTVLPVSAYKVIDRRWLHRTDGGVWPSGLDVEDPLAFTVTVAFGRPVPVGGKRAAALLAGQIALQCAGQPCQLPQRVTQVSREGVTYTILDAMSVISEGRTGLAMVDLWLESDRQVRRGRTRMFIPGAESARKIRRP